MEQSIAHSYKNTPSQKSLSFVSLKTIQYISEHLEDLRIIYEKLKDDDILNKTPDDFPDSFRENKVFIWAYNRLKVCGIRHLDLFSLHTSTIFSLAGEIIEKPWLRPIIDNPLFNGAMMNMVHLYEKHAVPEYDSDFDKERRIVLKMLNVHDTYAINVSPNNGKATNFMQLAEKMITLKENKFSNVGEDDPTYVMECMKIIRKSRKNRACTLYTLEGDDFANYVKTLSNTNKYTQATIISDINKAYQAYGYLPFKFPYNEMLEQKQKTIDLLKTYRNGKRNSKKKTKKQSPDTKVKKITERQQLALDRINEIVNIEPTSVDRYYTMHLVTSDKKASYKDVLNADKKIVKELDPVLYRRFQKICEHSKEASSKATIDKYKEFASLIRTNARQSVGSTLYDLITLLPEYNHSDFISTVEYNPNLTQSEKQILRQFYTTKIEDSGCICVVENEKEFFDKLIVMKGKVVNDEFRRKVLDYMDSHNNTRYYGTFIALIRAIFAGKVKDFEFDIDTLDDYEYH